MKIKMSTEKIEESVEAHPSAIFSTRNFIWNNPGSNPGLRDEKPVSTRPPPAPEHGFKDSN
jgi:hypothetical protein